MHLRALKSSQTTTKVGSWTLSIVLAVVSLSGVAAAQQNTDFAVSVDALVSDIGLGATAEAEDSPRLLRRLYLGLIGIPPTLDELNRYTSDTAPDRYAQEIERLIGRTEFVEHWAEQFDVMLMERRPNTNVPQDQWSQWLRDQIAASRPINQWMAELIVANGTKDENRAIARFLLDRGGDPHAVSRDIGRIYFGRDLQCAQCHDHPSIDSYLQTDYHGLLGFMSAMKQIEVTEGTTITRHIEEKSASDTPFESVFKRGTMHRVMPHLFTSAEPTQPWPVPGEEFKPVEAGKPLKPIHSRRQQLCDAINRGDVELFNRNLANRIWAIVFGRGIVEPLDLQHADNPPLNDKLVGVVAARLVEDKFDLRSFVRDLVLTQSYRRGALPLDYNANAAPTWVAGAVQRASEKKPELDASIAKLTESVEAAEKAFDVALTQVAPLEGERLTALANVDTARTAYASLLDAANKANAEKATAEQALATAKDKAAKLQAAVDSSNVALQAVGTDAELSALIAGVTTKVAAANAAIPPIEQDIAAKTAAAKTASEAAANSKNALVSVQGTADGVNARYAEAMVGVNSVRESMDQTRAELARANGIKAQYDAIAAWSEVQGKLVASQNERQQAVAQTDKLRVQLADNAQQQKNHQETLTAINAKLAAATSQQQTVRDRMGALDGQLNELKVAKEKLVSVSTLVKNNDSFAAAFAELDNSSVAIQSDRSSVEKQVADSDTNCQSCQAELATIQQTLQQLQTQAADAQTKLQVLQESVTKCDAVLTALGSQSANSLQAVYQNMGARFQAADLVPLTPEQIGWSALSVTGVYQNYIDKHLGELEKETPSTEQQRADAQFMQTRKAAAIRRARAELQGNVNTFINLYGAGPGQPQRDFFATADQALFTSNGGAIFGWSAPSGRNVAQRVVEAPNPAEAAAVLYRGVLCRDPSQEEIQSVEKYFAQMPDNRARMAQEMVWSLVASAEFRFLQ